MNRLLPRRALLGDGLRALGGAATAALVAGCTPRETPLAGVVAYPERSLAYAPLLLGVGANLYQSPPWRVGTLLRSGGAAVAAALAAGEADAGALALPDLLAAIAAGAPLVSFGALTRRFAGQLVATAPRPKGRSFEALLAGAWRAVPVGVQLGGDGTERFARSLFLRATGAGARATQHAQPLLADDPLAGEPRFVGYRTDEALVAAWRDGRVDAFLGHSLATAPATLLGGGELVANFSTGGLAPAAAVAHCTVLAARRDRLADSSGAAGRSGLLRALVQACGQASADLSGAGRARAAQRALPERDTLHVATAIELDSPSAGQSAYALDGRLPPDALPALLDLRAQAGSPLRLAPADVAVDL